MLLNNLCKPNFKNLIVTAKFYGKKVTRVKLKYIKRN